MSRQQKLASNTRKLSGDSSGGGVKVQGSFPGPADGRVVLPCRGSPKQPPIIEVTYTATAHPYGKLFVGDPFTVPVEKAEIRAVVKATDEAAQAS